MMTLPILASLPNVSATTTTYTVHYQYTLNGVTSDIEGAFVGLYRSSSLNGDYSRVDIDHTDSSGIVAFDVTVGYYYYTRLKASDDDQVEVCNTNDDNNDYQWYQSTHTHIVSGYTYSMTETITTNAEVWECYNIIRYAHSWQCNNSGTSSDTSRAQVYYPSGSSASTSTSTGDLYIGTASYLTNWLVILHEYGHHVQFDAQDGFSNDAKNGIVSPHYIYTEYASNDAAFVEGWAEFFSAAVMGTSSIYGGNIDNQNVNYCLANVLDSDTYDGCYVEGAIAEALWDLIDTGVDHKTWNTNGNGDQVSGLYSLIWHLMDSDETRSMVEFLDAWDDHDYLTTAYDVFEMAKLQDY